MTGWDNGLAEWWVREVATDTSYTDEVLPLALRLLDPQPGHRYLDVGCGEGRVMRAIGARGAAAIGCDVSLELAQRAVDAGHVTLGRLPGLSWLRSEAVDGAIVVLVLEHVEDHRSLFAELARVVRPGGHLALVVNHPVITAPGSAPLMDPEDGEITWRWGDYFGTGSSEEPASGEMVRFHHRSLGELLTAAATSGWVLEMLAEEPVGDAKRAADPLLAAQGDIPRLLGVRWRRTGRV